MNCKTGMFWCRMLLAQSLRIAVRSYGTRVLLLCPPCFHCAFVV